MRFTSSKYCMHRRQHALPPTTVRISFPKPSHSHSLRLISFLLSSSPSSSLSSTSKKSPCRVTSLVHNLSTGHISRMSKGARLYQVRTIHNTNVRTFCTKEAHSQSPKPHHLIDQKPQQWAFFGLGNPGNQYYYTRHNVGFLCVDQFFRKYRGIYNFSEFHHNSNASCDISSGKYERIKMTLCKPQTMMNLSGIAVNSIQKNMGLKDSEICIIYDDIYLPMGKIKIATSGGSGGQRGIQHILQTRSTNTPLVRVKVGVGLENDIVGSEERISFVLSDFGPKQGKILPKVLEVTAEALHMIAQRGPTYAQNYFNRRIID